MHGSGSVKVQGFVWKFSCAILKFSFNHSLQGFVWKFSCAILKFSFIHSFTSRSSEDGFTLYNIMDPRTVNALRQP